MSNKTFADLANGFGIVTVMNAKIYKPNRAYVGSADAFTKNNFTDTGLYLNTLKIANISMEGPTKTITGGQFANPLIKYGKTMTMEMQDALGRFTVMEEFFGCEKTGNRLSVKDKFPGAFAIEGDTFFIDQESGEKVDVHIFIPQFLPDGIFNLTQDAEGDATVFDLNGSVSVTKIDDGTGEREVFYEIRDTSFFDEDDFASQKADAINAYKQSCAAVGATPDAAKIAAIQAASSKTAIDSAFTEALKAVQRPAT